MNPTIAYVVEPKRLVHVEALHEEEIIDSRAGQN